MEKRLTFALQYPNGIFRIHTRMLMKISVLMKYCKDELLFCDVKYSLFVLLFLRFLFKGCLQIKSKRGNNHGFFADLCGDGYLAGLT